MRSWRGSDRYRLDEHEHRRGFWAPAYRVTDLVAVAEAVGVMVVELATPAELAAEWGSARRMVRQQCLTEVLLNRYAFFWFPEPECLPIWWADCCIPWVGHLGHLPNPLVRMQVLSTGAAHHQLAAALCGPHGYFVVDFGSPERLVPLLTCCDM